MIGRGSDMVVTVNVSGEIWSVDTYVGGGESGESFRDGDMGAASASFVSAILAIGRSTSETTAIGPDTSLSISVPSAPVSLSKTRGSHAAGEIRRNSSLENVCGPIGSSVRSGAGEEGCANRSEMEERGDWV